MSTERTDTAERNGERWVWRLVGIGAAVILVLWIGAKWLHGVVPTDSVESSARLEAAYAALETLFSGLAFLGVIAAVLFQREELKLQRQELRETREELKRTATAQEAASTFLAEQAKTMAKNARIGALQALLSEVAGRQASTAGNTAAGAHMRIQLMKEAEPFGKALRRELREAGLDLDANPPSAPPSATP